MWWTQRPAPCPLIGGLARTLFGLPCEAAGPTAQLCAEVARGRTCAAWLHVPRRVLLGED